MAKWNLDKSCDPNILVLNECILKLEAQIKEDALQYLSDTGQMGDTIDDLTQRHQHALHKIDVLEDKITKALHALRITDRWLTDLGMYANPDYHLAPSLQSVRDTLKELDSKQGDHST